MSKKENFVGLDIADHTIEILEITGSGKKPTLSLKNRLEVESGIIEWGRIKDPKRLADLFAKLFSISAQKQISKENVLVSLPDSLVYVHIFHLPPHSKREREKLLLKELQSIVPEKLDNILYSYQIFSEEKDVVKGMLVAMPKDAAVEWFDFFKKNKINVEFLDIEPVALRRAVFYNQKNEKICLVDIGAQSTSVNILNKERFYFSYNTHIAGDYFTREISNKLNLNLAEAEKEKIKNGLNGSDKEINTIVQGAIDRLIVDIKNIIEVNDDKEHKLVKIVLVGGASQTAGLVEYLQSHFEIPVSLFTLEKSFKTNDVEYIEAFGLALRSFDKKEYSDEPVITEKQIGQKNGAYKLLKKDESDYIRNLDEHFDVVGVSPEVNFDRYNPDTKKVSRTIWLLAFLFISILLLLGAFFFRENNRKSRQIESLKSSQNFTDVVQYRLQDLSIQVPVAVSATEYNKNRVRAKIFSDIILKIDLLDNQNNENSISQASKARALKQVSSSEELYPFHVEKIDNKDELIYKWLIFSNLDIKNMTIEKINTLNTNRIPCLFESLNIVSVEVTSNPNVYMMNVDVKVSSNQDLNI